MLLEITNEASLEDLIFETNNRLVLLYFWAHWSKVSKSALHKIGTIGKELEDDLIIGLVNSEQQKYISLKFDVKNIPTLIAFINGEPVERLSGLALTNNERIIKFIEYVDKNY